MNKNVKQKITLENVLCLFVILCPIFDILSFGFRNIFKTSVSISTFLRPIIPVAVAIYIFIKSPKKEKKIFSAIGLIYIFYGIIHLIVMKSLITKASYGTAMNEAQYILNFTFLVIYFIIYMYVFIYRKIEHNDNSKTENKWKSTKEQVAQIFNYDNDFKKLKKSITIMSFIYIVSIIIAIITKTSSYTYQETSTGYKGWIESGNSLSAILTLSLIIIICQIKETKKVTTIIPFLMICAYLTTTVGTRVGLIGTFLVVAVYVVLEVIFSKNKKIITIGIITMVIFAILVGTLGSSTIKRRKQMSNAKYEIIDEKTNEVGTMTGDMLRIKNKILDNELEEGYMSEAERQAVLELYDYSQKHNFAGNDTRRQQLMFNLFLVKNQKNISVILFGNGYKTNFREMVMENELASMVLNFGIIGFVLYVGPLIAILIYSIYIAFKKIKKTNVNFLMYQFGLALALVLSWMSGYVLFATSSMIVIVTLCTLLLYETLKIKANTD